MERHKYEFDIYLVEKLMYDFSNMLVTYFISKEEITMGADINTTQPDNSSEIANALDTTNTKLNELALLKTELAALKAQMTTMASNSGNLASIKSDLDSIKASLTTLAGKNFGVGGVVAQEA